MKIEDNFLGLEEFNKIQEALLGCDFHWFYADAIDTEDDVDKFQFSHVFFNYGAPDFASLTPILKILNPLSIWRIKTNLLTRTPKIVENKFHIDIGYLEDFPEKLKQWTTSIFYVNTNNGYTKFEDGTKVESVANRMVTFPSNMKHTGTSCTNEKVRVVINFNYFTK